MPLLIRQFASFLARKVTSDPDARDKAFKAVDAVAKEVSQIAKEDDRAYATGKAVRRILKNL